MKIACDVCGKQIDEDVYTLPIIHRKVRGRGPGVREGVLYHDVCAECVESIRTAMFGVKQPPLQGRPVTVDKDKVIALHKAGRTASEIGDEVKCGKNTVYRIISEYKNGRSGD